MREANERDKDIIKLLDLKPYPSITNAMNDQYSLSISQIQILKDNFNIMMFSDKDHIFHNLCRKETTTPLG